MSEYRTAPTLEEVIEDAIQREDWFSAFSNAVTYFEFWAYIWLGRYCRKENILQVEEPIKRLTATQLNLILHLLKLTDSNIFNKMKGVIKERNKHVHPANVEQMLGYRHKEKRKEKDRAIQILEDAKHCIRKVREGAFESFK